MITTEQCLLNPNRNPGRTREEVEELLKLYLGARKVIWLGDGFRTTETDGHVDNIACFAAPGRVIVGVPASRSHPDYSPVQEALRRLRTAHDARDRALEVIELPQPKRTRNTWSGKLACELRQFLSRQWRHRHAGLRRCQRRACAVLADCFPGATSCRSPPSISSKAAAASIASRNRNRKRYDRRGRMTITLAVTQFAMSWDRPANIARAKAMVREAAKKGAQAILLPEFFETPYFCQDQSAEHFALAQPFEGNTLIAEFAELARELGVVLPLSFFERAGNAHFNALAMIDADGRVLGRYRKSHIPDGPGYQEKFYFTPGDTGFQVWKTRYGRLGAAICWDQWFPEAARTMALAGAEVLFYPTAIGSEPPPAPPVDSRDHWRRVMQGHAAANVMPLIASNRIGTERGQAGEIAF